jgi:hypothetical protein
MGGDLRWTGGRKGNVSTVKDASAYRRASWVVVSNVERELPRVCANPGSKSLVLGDSAGLKFAG